MASIGSFKKVGTEFQGQIVTLIVQTKGVRIAPETNRVADNAPSHRVFVGRAEIGAAWTKRSNEGREYLSVKLDDPSFNTPIYANLFDAEDGHATALRPGRSRRSRSPARSSPREARGPRAIKRHSFGDIPPASVFKTPGRRSRGRITTPYTSELWA